jgi:hypothetical protein
MKQIKNHWLPFLAVVGLITLAYLLINWTQLSTTHRLSLLITVCIIAHIHEEERYPGGFGYLFNVVANGEREAPDRYPLSLLSAMVVDYMAVFILFVPMFLGFLELGVHSGMGIRQKVKFGYGIYNPGLFTATLTAGIAVAYSTTVVSQGLMSGSDWLWAAVCGLGGVILCIPVPEHLLKSRTTTWAFEPKHFLGWYSRYTTLEEVLASSR